MEITCLLPSERRATNTAGTPGSVITPGQLIKLLLDQNQLNGSVHTDKAETFLQNGQGHSVAACKDIKEICLLQKTRHSAPGWTGQPTA